MMDFDGRSVLVTGGAGFIGSHMVDALLRRGCRVTVVDSLVSGRRENLAGALDAIDFHELDLNDAAFGEIVADGRFDAIFHLAANAHVMASVEDPRADLERNVLATFNLLEAVRHGSPATPVLHASTAAVYGEGVRMPIREEDPTFPVSPYGVSKLAAERYVAAYAGLYGLRTANLRLFSVYGPRLRKQVVYDLMRKIRRDPSELPIYGDGSQTRDFNHVSNVVEAFLVVAGRGPLEGEVYNVAADEPVRIDRLARLLCEAMDVSPRFQYSGAVRPGEPQRWFADTSRLKELGYTPRLGLAEGLSETVAWFLEEESVAATG